MTPQINLSFQYFVEHVRQWPHEAYGYGRLPNDCPVSLFIREQLRQVYSRPQVRVISMNNNGDPYFQIEVSSWAHGAEDPVAHWLLKDARGFYPWPRGVMAWVDKSYRFHDPVKRKHLLAHLDNTSQRDEIGQPQWLSPERPFFVTTKFVPPPVNNMPLPTVRAPTYEDWQIDQGIRALFARKKTEVQHG